MRSPFDSALCIFSGRSGTVDPRWLCAPRPVAPRCDEGVVRTRHRIVPRRWGEGNVDAGIGRAARDADPSFKPSDSAWLLCCAFIPPEESSLLWQAAVARQLLWCASALQLRKALPCSRREQLRSPLLFSLSLSATFSQNIPASLLTDFPLQPFPYFSQGILRDRSQDERRRPAGADPGGVRCSVRLGRCGAQDENGWENLFDRQMQAARGQWR